VKPEHRRTYSQDPTNEIWIGKSSWDANARATKFAWRNTANGAWARGGEQPLWAVVDEVALATEAGELTWDDIFGAIFDGCSAEEAVPRVAAILGALNRQLSKRASGPQSTQ
jgi:hypothetical protein